MGRLVKKLIIMCFLIGSFMPVSSAQEAEALDTAVTKSTPKPIEEITVVGQRSLARLQLRIEEKKAEIYSFFNDQNSSNRMDIICRKRRATGTFILKRECEPRFLTALRVEKTRDARMGIGVGFNQYDLVGLSAQDFEKLQNEMLALMAANEDFAKRLADLAELSENYDAHRKAMWGEQ